MAVPAAGEASRSSGQGEDGTPAGRGLAALVAIVTDTRGTTAVDWRPLGSYRVVCNECPWLRVEQFKRAAFHAAHEHANETGHTVDVQRSSYRTIRPRPA